MSKKNKSLIALLLVAIVGIVGLTIAYFSNSTTIDNEFQTKEYGTTYTEEFVSPNNWLPGDTTDKTVTVTNSGSVDEAVRISLSETWTPNDSNATLTGWIHADGTKSNHTTESELATDKRAAVINFTENSDWTKVGDYYYYNYKLAPGQTTDSLIESVTFNALTKLGDTCTPSTSNGVTTITCNSSGSDYDNATYKLTINIETVQYNKYNEAWNLNNTVMIGRGDLGSEVPPEESTQPELFAQHIIDNSNSITVIDYNNGVKTEAYTFSHSSTNQTDALTDYRYIGDIPNNYVYFNCTDDNDNSTCEIWRALGVFSVDDGTGNVEQRVKLVSEDLITAAYSWRIDNGFFWNNSTLEEYLSGDYFDSLSNSSKLMIDDAVFYLGLLNQTGGGTPSFGDSDTIYSDERNNDFTNETNWLGKIGLIYPSDFTMIFGYGIDDCYDHPTYCGENGSNNWFTSLHSDRELVMARGIDHGSNVYLRLGYNSYDSSYSIYYLYSSISETENFRPTLYLSSNVKIQSGDGSIGSPYKLTL